MEELNIVNTSTQTAIHQISIEAIYVDKDYPYGIREESSEYKEIMESISEIGIIDPLILLDTTNEITPYRVIHGARRLHIARNLGLHTVPSIVLNDIDEYMVNRYRNDSNLKTRKTILPSEKAKAYQMELAALNHKSIKGQPLSHEALAERTGESSGQIKRIVRLNKLTPEMLNLVDSGRLSIRTASDYAYKLEADNQKRIVELTKGSESIIVQSKIISVLKLQEDAEKLGEQLSDEDVRLAFNKNTKEIKVREKDFILPYEEVKDLLPDTDKDKQLLYIREALRSYKTINN